MSGLKPRFQGHEAFNAVVRADWVTAIKLSPDSYDAYLYCPVKSAPVEAGGNYEEQHVMELDINQDAIEYADRVLVRVLDCPDEAESLLVHDSGGSNLGESDGMLLLRIASETDIPVGSALEWLEEINEGELRTVYWYVQDILGFGTANVGSLYACVPMRNFQGDSSISGIDEDTTNDTVSGTSTDTINGTTTDTSGDTSSDTVSDTISDTVSDTSIGTIQDNSGVMYI
ncbi:hypothetical protein K6U51_12440 [Vibrio fluvialis]|uniref:hypothetical protein n=1 Tax=Vibrio fluvialis TaxID=676 RepID=UPI001EEB3D2C|nr:hypothetical protein [Vibrio fluvialis]MCG6387512.1 hypothetical protein [Vibrio fluvialis]MCG6418841.1 hypothetical protein [Vibrio fluvialis]